MDTQIQIQIENGDKELIKKAATLLSVGHSTFARIATMEKARQVLKENQEAAQ